RVTFSVVDGGATHSAAQVLETTTQEPVLDTGAPVEVGQVQVVVRDSRISPTWPAGQFRVWVSVSAGGATHKSVQVFTGLRVFPVGCQGLQSPMETGGKVCVGYGQA